MIFPMIETGKSIIQAGNICRAYLISANSNGSQSQNKYLPVKQIPWITLRIPVNDDLDLEKAENYRLELLLIRVDPKNFLTKKLG